MRSAVVAGHVCVDLTPELPTLPASRPGELTEVGAMRVSPGGCVANTGGDLAALGATVDVVGDAGDDELGAALVQMLAARGTRATGAWWSGLPRNQLELPASEAYKVKKK